MRVVCMELKFDPKYKSAVFRAKYLKSEIEFEDHYMLCICRVFAAFPSLWRPFGAIFCLTVDAAARQSKATTVVRDKTSHRPLNRISPKTLAASRSSEKRLRHSKHTTGKVFKLYFDFKVFLMENCQLFSIEFQLSYFTLWKPVLRLLHNLLLNNLSLFSH